MLLWIIYVFIVCINWIFIFNVLVDFLVEVSLFVVFRIIVIEKCRVTGCVNVVVVDRYGYC